MAPQVQVPMDFGVKYLGSPSHGNLKFRLKDGEKISANSMIISYNSAVIEYLTTDLLQTSIDVDDFSKEALQCFLESCYSGKLQKITRENFRDANKMANVFEVSWLENRCLQYFEGLVAGLDVNSYEDQLFLFQEAMFTWLLLERKCMIEVVIKKFSSEIVKCSKFFVPQFLSNLASKSTIELDIIIKIVGKQKHVLMEILISDVERNCESLSLNSRHLLENVSFADCFKDHVASYEKLFDSLAALKTPSKEDYGLILQLLRNYEKPVPHSDGLNRQSIITVPNCKFMTFRHLRDLPDLNELMKFLKSFPFVNNSYIFFDALYCWVVEKFQNVTFSISDSSSFADTFIDLILERGWKPLASEYLKGKEMPCTKTLIAKLNMVRSFKSFKNYSRLLSVDDYRPEDLFGKDNDVKFYLKGYHSRNCPDTRKCGFILRVTGMAENEDDTFNIQLVTDPMSYPSDIVFHSGCSNVASMHLALEIDKYNDKDYPISWSGRPSRDGTNKYYLWGQHRFYNARKKEGAHPKVDDHKRFWSNGSDVKLRLIVYYFG